jgi:hypothetical protein
LFRPDLGNVYLVSKVSWTVFPRCLSDIEALSAHAYRPDGALSPAQLAALRARASGIAPGGGFFAVSDQDQSPAPVNGHLRLILGSAAGHFDAGGRETELVAGV